VAGTAALPRFDVMCYSDDESSYAGPGGSVAGDSVKNRFAAIADAWQRLSAELKGRHPCVRCERSLHRSVRKPSGSSTQ
jgi:hypothetical protein